MFTVKEVDNYVWDNTDEELRELLEHRCEDDHCGWTKRAREANDDRVMLAYIEQAAVWPTE